MILRCSGAEGRSRMETKKVLSVPDPKPWR